MINIFIDLSVVLESNVLFSTRLYDLITSCLPTRLLLLMLTAQSLAPCSTPCLMASTWRTTTLCSRSTHTLGSCVCRRTSTGTLGQLSTTSWSRLRTQWVDLPLPPSEQKYLFLLIHTLQPLLSLIFFSFSPRWQGGLSAQTYVHIQVEDLNDNAPVFDPDHYTMSISSHTQPGTEILNVIATDGDSGSFGQVTYELLTGDMSSLFALDTHSGR